MRAALEGEKVGHQRAEHTRSGRNCRITRATAATALDRSPHTSGPALPRGLLERRQRHSAVNRAPLQLQSASLDIGSAVALTSTENMVSVPELVALLIELADEAGTIIRSDFGVFIL